MPADPVAAGRKGGSSRSAKKVAASRRNGFQRVKPAPESETQSTQPICSRQHGSVLVAQNQETK